MNPVISQDEYAELEVLAHMGNELYRRVHVEIARKIGILEAYLLEDLIDNYKYFKKEESLKFVEGFGNTFYYDHKRCDERMAMSEKQMLRTVKSLFEQGLIDYRVVGLSRKRHFKINFKILSEISKNVSQVPKWELRDSQMGTSRFPNGNLYINTNITSSKKEQQQPAAVKKSATPPVVVSSLDKIKITPKLKQTLLAKYSIPEIDIAVSRLNQWPTRNSDAKAIQHLLKNPDQWEEPPENPEILKKRQEEELTLLSQENKEWAIKFLEEIDHHPFTICEKYVEFRDKHKRFGQIHYNEEKKEFQKNLIYIYKQLSS